ncbi:hypothetical protein X975_09346, partial [Stegodyphus mimosarum]
MTVQDAKRRKFPRRYKLDAVVLPATLRVLTERRVVRMWIARKKKKEYVMSSR